MKKREFLKLTGIVGAGVVVSPFLACETATKTEDTSAADASGGEERSGANMVFELPPLAYAFDALQPAIDARTMEIHHDRHHAGYVRKLNAALDETSGFEGMDIEAILAAVKEDQTGVRNNGGGHWNHTLYWDIMAPGGANAPSGQLADAINSAFGSYEEFADKFYNAAKTRFGSGWAWLSVDKDNKLFVSSTPNQDNPLMTNISEMNGTPVLGIDVWEHAYYLKYQNKRGDYINSFMEIINWENVAGKFAALMG